MNLALQSETVGKVVVIRCQGRIVTGDETLSLQQEIERHARATKKIVLQMAEVKYVDSGGLGALVRIAGVLRSYHGDLKLCQISSFVHQVLQATGLLKVFHTYALKKKPLTPSSKARNPTARLLRGSVRRSFASTLLSISWPI